ncbi:hypothetical protein CCC_01432 [Paramagnetospirillum magnetotacticum MS-1]|uniref:Uncharacterized protein n=1 Tax=Paramagnetospirillum magnetotacticum MS-1 TaxID=272627 RepID=A0A0C2YB06_PARME|nr:hypothetical protein [Paramagnetospirillum magnetotacticum]KIL96939.1 hypothetical protein CCC_01432 [Paramagnetospirillum magnetotacticum MS-1]
MSIQLLERLRKKMSFDAIPDTIEVPPSGDETTSVIKAIEDASVDDVALAIQVLEKASSALIRQVSGLRRLHDYARCAGAIGVSNAVEAAIQNLEAE